MKAFALAFLAPLLLAQSAPRLVPDVSQRRIDIVYSFTGAELLLFGAILYPGGRLPTRDADIAIVIKGPAEPIVLREKQKVAGMWINADSARFRSVPSFYAIATSRPLNTLVDDRTAAVYELGVDNIQLSPASGKVPDEQRRLERGLVDLKRRAGLYAEEQDGVQISEGVLYRARIHLPARVPVGTYTAETFLLQGGRVVAGATREIAIEKSGFERYVAAAAADRAFLYGLFAVLVSLLLGWAGALLFRRLR
ncbi:TIGR02186 family protein [Sphingomonas montana]|uniref:TIGR02186 family protein n=1 Tax=Sphingomonas montana TaxID=1843236 RepID=UPI00096E9613|nr:TIGR02186 family protein [Sphingomonas montana]